MPVAWDYFWSEGDYFCCRIKEASRRYFTCTPFLQRPLLYQVLKATSRFSNSCISYHIFHSLHRKSSLLFDVAYETKTVPALKTPKKDTRKSWYTRIGVIRKTQKSLVTEASKIFYITFKMYFVTCILCILLKKIFFML